MGKGWRTHDLGWRKSTAADNLRGHMDPGEYKDVEVTDAW